MCKLTNVVFVIIIEFLCTKLKTRFTSIPSYKIISYFTSIPNDWFILHLAGTLKDIGNDKQVAPGSVENQCCGIFSLQKYVIIKVFRISFLILQNSFILKRITLFSPCFRFYFVMTPYLIGKTQWRYILWISK